jgi:hypothetical protein
MDSYGGRFESMATNLVGVSQQQLCPSPRTLKVLEDLVIDVQILRMR